MHGIKGAVIRTGLYLHVLLGLVPGIALAGEVLVAVEPHIWRQAIETAAPGTTLLLAAGEYGVLDLVEVGGTAARPLILRSADPANPAVFSGMALNKVHNLVLEGLVFDYRYSPGDKRSFRPFDIVHSQDVTIRAALFDGDVAREVSAVDDGFGYAYALGVQMSEDVTVEQSDIRGFMRGLVIFESRGVTVRGNDLHNMRSDGMDFAQVQDVLIEDNLIRDFAHSPTSGDHPDMIQFWTTGTTAPSTDIVIRNNVLNAGTGWFTQSIFMRNELVGKGKAGAEMFYRNVTIEGNVIINAHVHGITVGETAGLTIANNTIIKGSAVQGVEDASKLWIPRINVAVNATDVSILRNVVPDIAEHEPRPDWNVTENYLVQEESFNLPGFYDTVFVAARTGDQAVLSSFRPMPGGPLDDTDLGAPRLNNLETPAVLTPLIRAVADQAALNRFTFDAGLSRGPDGAPGPDTSYSWDFGDGQGAAGPVVTHVYAASGRHDVLLRISQTTGGTAETTARIVVPGADVLRFDADGGQFMFWKEGAATPVPDLPLPPGPLRLGGGQAAISLPVEATAPIFDANDFDLRFRLRATGDDPAGDVLRFHPNLIVSVTPRGAIEVRFDTGKTSAVNISSGHLSLFSGNWHDITIAYTDSEDRLVVEVDGRVVAQGQASGRTMATGDPLAIGNPFHPDRSFSGEIESLRLRVNTELFIVAPN